MELILERAPPKNRMAAAARKLVVETGDVPVLGGRRRPTKSITDKVDAVALAGIKTRCRKCIKVVQHGSVRPEMKWIQSCYVLRTQALEARLDLVRTRQPLHGSPGTGARIITLV